MSTVNSNPANQQISTSFANAARDGQITRKEARELNAFIDSTSLPAADKSAAKSMVSQLNKASTGSFLFFNWKSKVTPSEMQGLQNLAQTNNMAKSLLQSFTEANPTPAVPTRSPDRSQVGSKSHASFQPGGGLFGSVFNSRNAASSQRTGGVQPLSTPGRTPSWIVSQNGTGLASASGDCGPSSAAMVARRFGFNTQMDSREAVQAARDASGVTSRRRGAWAIDENEVTKSIQKMSGGKINETADTGLLRSGNENRGKIVNALRESLSRGDMPILLTGSPSTSSRHYMVVTDVKENGNLVMADPAGGRTWEMTPNHLDQLMHKADRRGGSRVMAYNQ